MFRARKMDLPVVTEVLFLTSDFISNYWFVLIPGLVGGGWNKGAHKPANSDTIGICTYSKFL